MSAQFATGTNPPERAASQAGIQKRSRQSPARAGAVKLAKVAARKGSNQPVGWGHWLDRNYLLADLESTGRTIWIVDAHGHGKRFVVGADEKLGFRTPDGSRDIRRAIVPAAEPLCLLLSLRTPTKFGLSTFKHEKGNVGRSNRACPRFDRNGQRQRQGLALFRGATAIPH